MRQSPQETEQMILRALGNGPQTHAGIVSYTGMNRETVRLALIRLRHRSAVIKEGGVFLIPFQHGVAA